MLSLILFLFELIFINSIYEPNISNVDHFVETLYNITLNVSNLGKLSTFINPRKYCSIFDDILFICIECQQNYTLLNGECVCYDRNCKSCLSSLYGACTECHTGYALSTDNTCRCKIEHCLLCDDHICNVCERGYILSEFNTSCEISYEYKNGEYCFDIDCEICMNDLEGSCLKCKDGYNLVNGTCELNPSLEYYFQNKILCPDNYMSIGEGCNKICLGAKCNIDENALYASCGSKCIYCMQGILYDTLNCNMSDFCYDQKCTKCRNNEIGMCDRCEIGYRLSYGRCIEKCQDPNCLNCDYTLNGSCNWCKKGYVLTDGKCYIKNEGVSLQELKDIYEQETFILAENNNISYKGNGDFEIYLDNQTMLIDYTELMNYIYTTKFNKLCSAKNCKSCMIDNPKYCLTCLDNFSNRNGQCVKCEIPHCALCLLENDCNRCQENYTLIKNQCIKNINIQQIHFCLNYDHEICTQCEDDYILDKGRCTLNEIYKQNTSYEIMSCSKENYRKQICLKKYYYRNGGCLSCRDPKCSFCYDNIGCIICENGYDLIDGRCLKKSEFNETVKNCISYDYDGKCIRCDSLCILKGGECNCKIVKRIIIYLTIGILVVIIAWIVLSIFMQRDSLPQHEELIENDLQLIEDNKITQQELQLLQEKDKNLKKCFYCKIETALYRLSCGCLLCKDDFKELMEKLNESEINLDTEISNNIIIKKKPKNNARGLDILENSSSTKINKRRCPCCLKFFEAHKQIAQQCEICFETTTKIFHFKCGCALSVCKNCFNKIIVNRKCPGCRKNILFS